jgi:hypothetical protein
MKLYLEQNSKTIAEKNIIFRIKVAINILFEKEKLVGISCKISCITRGNLLCKSLTGIYYLIWEFKIV